jgi:cell wall-associated NlpC family hydrolase
MVKLKEIMKRLSAFLVFTYVLTVSTLAYTGTGTVKAATIVDVMSSCSASSTVVGKLYNGTAVDIIGKSGSWYKISYSGATGWVLGEYLTAITASGTDSDIQTVLGTAETMIGVAYAYSGTSPTTGFDCSGFTMYCYAQAGVELPHSAEAQSAMGTSVAEEDLQPGDLVFFDTDNDGTINHVGIYIGNDNFISAVSTSWIVKEDSLASNYWSDRYATSRRYID